MGTHLLSYSCFQHQSLTSKCVTGSYPLIYCIHHPGISQGSLQHLQLHNVINLLGNTVSALIFHHLSTSWKALSFVQRKILHQQSFPNKNFKMYLKTKQNTNEITRWRKLLKDLCVTRAGRGLGGKRTDGQRRQSCLQIFWYTQHQQSASWVKVAISVTAEMFLMRSWYLVRTKKDIFLPLSLSFFLHFPLSLLPSYPFVFSSPLLPLHSMTFTREHFCFDSRLQASKDQHCFLGEKTVASFRIESKPECTKWKINQGHHYSISLWFGLPSNLILCISEIAATPTLVEPSNALIKVSFRIKRQKCQIPITLQIPSIPCATQN